MRKIFPLERLSERVGDAAGDVCRLISHRMDGCVIDATLIDEDWTSEVTHKITCKSLLLLVLSQFLFQEAQFCVHLIKQLWQVYLLRIVSLVLIHY